MNEAEEFYSKALPVFFDTETTINNVGDSAVGEMAASPFCQDNYVVYLGTKTPHEQDVQIDEGLALYDFILDVNKRNKKTLLVAQNIAFDLLHLAQGNSTQIMRRLLCSKDVALWDVMLVEYLLTGQQLKWANLDTLATIYGGTVKDSRIKEYWEAGVCTSKIPREEIIPYLEDDVKNLQIIFEGQMKEAKRLGMLPLIRSQMRARAMTILMECNGMKFDLAKAHKQKEELAVIVKQREENIVKAMMEVYNPIGFDLPDPEINPASRKQLAVILFGGSLSVKVDEIQYDELGAAIVYKTGAKKGEVKTKKAIHHIFVKGMFPSTVASSLPKTPSGEVSTDTETLETLLKKHATTPQQGEFLKELIAYREESKMLITYFDGYSKLVWPDGRIHGQLNHCQTNTGRLSSSKPNLQNISNKSMEVDDESL